MRRLVTDAARFGSEWYLDLPPAMKVAYDYMWAHADCAGIWDVNMKLIEFIVGTKLDWDAFLRKTAGHVLSIATSKYYLPDYIPVIYGKLNLESKAHGKIFDALSRHEIDPEISPEHRSSSRP